jgi:LysR family transcriptional regulator, hydrogen peroxide-inducible genes activator
MLTTRQLRSFETLCDTLHFGRAARRLNVSQPALSGQIAQMEAFFGAPLFERRATGATLTREGEAVRAAAARVLAELRALEALAPAPGAVLEGRLRLGLIATVAPYLLPSLLPRLRANHPALRCEVRESLTKSLVEEIALGDLDCAVIALPLEAPSLAILPLAEDPFLLAVPSTDAARLPAAPAVSDLSRETLILLEEGHCLRDQALQVCRLAEAGELASFGATSLNTILQMVAGGLGSTLVPSVAARAEARPGLTLLPFAEPAPSRSLVLAFRASSPRRRDFAALAELIRDALAAPAQ